jgi:hypothetical protein
MFLVLAIFMFLGSAPDWAAAAMAPSTYDIVLAAKACSSTKVSQSIECNYKVGKDLYFTIAGVGEPDAGVTFMKSSYDGDFYASFGIMHGCVIVKRGPKVANHEIAGPGSLMDFAFVSPRNGKVYRTWEDCGSSRNEK